MHSVCLSIVLTIDSVKRCAKPPRQLIHQLAGGVGEHFRSVGIAASHVPPPEKLLVDTVWLQSRLEPVFVGSCNPVSTGVGSVYLERNEWMEVR